MSDTLDLDKLEPEAKKFTLHKKEYTIYPAKMRGIIAIEKYFRDVKKMEGQESIDRALEILTPLIPEFKDNKEIDFSAEQMMALMSFAYHGKEIKPTKESKKKGE